MTDLGDEILRKELGAIAARHDVSRGATEHLFAALSHNGSQAQFNHPELGGLGQWSRGGMLMIGDMFNHSLKAKVAVLCSEIADIASRSVDVHGLAGQQQSQYQGSDVHRFGSQTALTSNWWPKELGSPSATGVQNNMRYAFFPASRRLALSVDGAITVYDTKDHLISGFSQQQSGEKSVTFSSQHGRIDLAQLEKMPPTGGPTRDHGPEQAGAGQPEDKKFSDEPTVPHGCSERDIFEKIERLASLHAKGILTDQEFAAKKTELLARL